MDKKIFVRWSLRDLFVAIGPLGFAIMLAVVAVYFYVDPAPPSHLTIATGDADQSDLAQFAKEYSEILKQDGVRLDVKSTSNPYENLKALADDNANVDAAFVPDGLGSMEKQPYIESLGSVYYQPIWIFYRGNKAITHISELNGRKVSIGQSRHGTSIIAKRLLRLNGVITNATPNIVNLDAVSAAAALKKGEIDAAFFILPAESPLILDLFSSKDIHVLDNEQAEGIERMNPTFHHLVLARGAIDLKNDKPDHDIDMVGTTTTLLIRDDLHPALQFLLLKAAAQLHGDPGIFEKRNEFPSNKDDSFPLSADAGQYYKSGTPFWQRYLPFWLAVWVGRFIFLVIPFLAIVLPLIRMVPKIYFWRLRQRIYHAYGELKYLETQIGPAPSVNEFEGYLLRLDAIEARVNKIRVPQNFAEHIYSLRGHIQLVRGSLLDMAKKLTLTQTPERQT